MAEALIERLLVAAAGRRATTRLRALLALPVGAALLDEHGRIHAGCNVENAAYPQGVCAEAGALAAMVLAGGRHVAAVLVRRRPAAGHALRRLPAEAARVCRRRLPVLVADSSGLRRRYTLGELLPDSFGPDHLHGGPMTHRPCTNMAASAATLRTRLGAGARPNRRAAGLGLGAAGRRGRATRSTCPMPTCRPFRCWAWRPCRPAARRAVGGRRAVLVLAGRKHAYETGEADGMKGAIRTLAALGVQLLVQTNAAGSWTPSMRPGELMLITDHLNLSQRSPLFGEAGDRPLRRHERRLRPGAARAGRWPLAPAPA
jgi:cytidine deaminase